MRFSIVTCTWNSEKYLPETLKSLSEQTFKNFEVIFVDGGSEDATLQLISDFDHPNVKVINNVRGGISNAMNVGIREARGEIIAHLHSDDYYADPFVLEKVDQSFHSENKDWLFGRILSDINNELFKESYIVAKYSLGRLLRGNFIPHPAVFIKSNIFKQCGCFDESLKYAMDYDLLIRIAKKFAPIQLDDYLTVFRRHAGSTSQANIMASFKEDFKVRCKYLTLMQYPEALLRYCIRYYKHTKSLKHGV